MYSYQRHTRNQHPTFGGQTLRVRNESGEAPPELFKAREQVVSACKRAGGLFAHWRLYTPEFNNGLCPVHNSRTKTPPDPSCEVCYGTNFRGGYSKPTVQYMIVQHSNRRLEATPTGFVRLNTARSQSPYLPNISTGDLIGEIKNLNGDLVVDDRYFVEDGVEKVRFRLADNFMTPNTNDHLDAESDVVSYDFESSRIPKHSDEELRDIKYRVPFEKPVWLADPTELGV